jgi:Asp-tRNA(Asn)/Glu-tRNA(Gln) amidotransferase A subunit family amidase
MADLELAYMSAAELAAAIRKRDLSPVEVMDNCLARIAEVNPELNCFCFVFAEEAMDQAREAAAAVQRGDRLGPLHGVPIAIKDFTPTKGKRTTRGSKAFENWVPDENALIVDRLCGAGAIMVGKTTTPEFAYSSFTKSPLWGITRNPWNREMTPGGSSGGSAAAVASGCVPMAEGTDMGGSVRIPASLCGIVGLKPSLGRIPMDILPTVFDNISHFGPLTRTIDDAALFMDAASGPYEFDIMSVRESVDFMAPSPENLAGKRFALSLDLGFMAVDPEVEARVREAAAALSEAGATIEEIDLDWSKEVTDCWVQNWGVYLAACFSDKLGEYREAMDPEVVKLLDAGLALDAVTFKQIEFVRTEQWRKLAKVFQRYDALLCPTMAQPAQPADKNDSDYDWVDGEGRYHALDMTCAFNNVGQCPALSVPAGFTSGGLPVGLQVVTPRFADIEALGIGAALEKQRPWSDRRPSL